MLSWLCDLELSLHPWPWPWIFKVKFWISRMGGLIDMEWKGWVDRMLDPLWYLELWPWPGVFHINFRLRCCPFPILWGWSKSDLKGLYPRNGRDDWHGTKGMWADRRSGPFSDFELWPWPWIFKVKFRESCVSGMRELIDMKRKECESKGCGPTMWPWAMTLTLYFQDQLLKQLYPMNETADWHGTKGIWTNRKWDPLCDFELWPHPWPWHWIFKVIFWKAVSQEWEGQITWNERDGSR